MSLSAITSLDPRNQFYFDDAYVGKATLSALGTWVYSDLILSMKPSIGEVDLSTSKINIKGQTLLAAGNELATQANRTLKNIQDENYLGDPDSIRLQNVTINVSRTKVNTETVIAGRTNSIIEHMTNGSLTLQCDAVLTSPWARSMPEQQVKKLIKILNFEEPLTLAGRYSNWFESLRGYVKSYNFPQERGKVNTQRVTFTITVVDADDSIEAVIE
jgi:hypothetical protein